MKPLALILMTCLIPAFSLHAAEKRGDELDQRVLAILETKCVMCHDRLGAAASAGINNLLKLDELASGYGNQEQPEKSELYQLLVGDKPRMPQRKLRDINWGGPLDAREKRAFSTG